MERYHKKALAAVGTDWVSLVDLLAQGFGALVFAELEVHGVIERRLNPVRAGDLSNPCGHVMYRRVSHL